MDIVTMRLSSSEVDELIDRLEVEPNFVGAPRPRLSGVPKVVQELIRSLLLDGLEYIDTARGQQAYFATPAPNPDTGSWEFICLDGDGVGPVTIFDTNHLDESQHITLAREDLSRILARWIELIHDYPVPYGDSKP